MKVYELLDSPEKWCQGALAKDAEGRALPHDSEGATAWCLVGACDRCYPDPQERSIVSDRLCQILATYGEMRRFGIAGWNDRTERTWMDIDRLVRALDI